MRVAGPTYKARMVKRRRAKAGTLAQTQAVLWQAILGAEQVLGDADTNAQTLQACHALAQACSAYAKLLQAGELEARVQALEALRVETVQHAVL